VVRVGVAVSVGTPLVLVADATGVGVPGEAAVVGVGGIVPTVIAVGSGIATGIVGVGVGAPSRMVAAIVVQAGAQVARIRRKASIRVFARLCCRWVMRFDFLLISKILFLVGTNSLRRVSNTNETTSLSTTPQLQSWSLTATSKRLWIVGDCWAGALKGRHAPATRRDQSIIFGVFTGKTSNVWIKQRRPS
jgi:hypothetical protein